MAVRCVKCGYEMKTWQESTSTLTHIIVGGAEAILKIIKGIRDSLEQHTSKAAAGIMNHPIGESKGVKCPSCGEIGRWEDIKAKRKSAPQD